MINLQAQGYEIISSNILQSMLKSKLHIRENVNKRMRCEPLVLFCCKKDIYSFNTSPQLEKEKKKGMMDINLRCCCCNIFKKGHHFPQSLAEHSYQSDLKYLEEK